MKMRLSCACIVGMMALAVTAAQSSANSIAAFTPSEGYYNLTNFNPVGNDGLVFTVGGDDITVTALGYFHDGAAHSNTVGIYRLSDDALLASTLVTTTADALAVPSFDYQSIAPIVLSAGAEYEVVGQEDYTILAQYTTTADAAHMNPAAGITFNGYFYDYNDTLDVPGNSYGDSYMGPNFQFCVSQENINPDRITSVPLPASAFAGLALLGCLLGKKGLNHLSRIPA